MDQPAAGPVHRAPASGRPRQRWLRARLIEILNTETEVCPQSVGASSLQLLELFERVVGEPYSDTPGACLASRLRALSTVLTNLLKGGLLASPLTRTPSRVAARWNRYPRVPADAEAWRRRVEAEETHQLPIVRTSALMAEVDAALARWVRMHRYLQPVELADGESGMALLLLWEVDHQRDFPMCGDDDNKLRSFTRRLKRRVAEDPELSGWLVSKNMQQPLAPGLADTHHERWSLRVCAPPADEPQGWYTEFIERWRAYLVTQTRPHQLGMVAAHTGAAASSSSSSTSTDQTANVRETIGQRRPRDQEEMETVAAATKRRRAPAPVAPPAAAPPARQREEENTEMPAAKWRRGLRGRLQPRRTEDTDAGDTGPRPVPGHPHGRGVDGAPT